MGGKVPHLILRIRKERISELKPVSVRICFTMSSSDIPCSLYWWIRSYTCCEISEYSSITSLCPHTSPSRIFTPCISRNIRDDLESVFLYEVGMWIALSLGHFATIEKISVFDGLKARCIISSLWCRVSISSFELTTLIFKLTSRFVQSL